MEVSPRRNHTRLLSNGLHVRLEQREDEVGPSSAGAPGECSPGSPRSGRIRYLTDVEEPQLLKALATEEDRQRLLILLQTGLRKSEFLGLRWRDVDFKVGVLTIPRSKNGDRRHVPMTSAVREILARRPRSLDGSALVFPNTVGNHDHR